MRMGINLLCLAGLIDESHRPVLELARECGYDGVEIPVLSGDVAHYERLARLLDELGLARTCTAIVASPDASPVSPDAASRARGRRHLEWIMDCAQALGADSVGGPFYAPLGHFTGAGPTESELLWCAQAHRAMAERAHAVGIYLSVEPLNRFETYFLNTAEQAHAYRQRVDHPALRLIYDTFHGHIEEKDQVTAVGTVAGDIGVLHVSENDRGIPGTGQVDFLSIFRAVQRTGFDGWVVTEAFGNSVRELAAATRVWRPLFPDVETLVRQSAVFMRKTWAQALQETADAGGNGAQDEAGARNARAIPSASPEDAHGATRKGLTGAAG